MTSAARIVAVVAGIACMFLAGAELVRQASLAADAGVRWPASSWWAGLTGEPTWATTGVAAGVMAAVTVVLIVLAVRQLGDRRRGPDMVEFAAGDTRTRLSVPGLEKALARRFEAVVPGSRVASVGLTKGAAGWRARVEASLPPRDVSVARTRALEALRGDLKRMGGMDLVRLDLVVTSLRAAGGKGA